MTFVSRVSAELWARYNVLPLDVQRQTRKSYALFSSNPSWQIIEAMILPLLELVTLAVKDYREPVRHCAAHGWSGGRVHDAIHFRCAQKASCDRIYTFNVKDFRALAPAELQDKISAP